MRAKDIKKEGWIMLLRPFDFAELKKPLQKLTILYAYSEKSIIKSSLSKEGRELVEEADKNIGKEMSPTAGHANIWRRGYGEHDDERYYARVNKKLARIFAEHNIEKDYQGEFMQCEVEGQLCKFYPDEYSMVSEETFEHVMTAEEYSLEIENNTPFTISDVRTKLFYIQSRGIDKNMAKRMLSKEMKDAVIFRPRRELLEYFCRDYEIY